MEGKAYEDKGRILELRPQARLRYSHFSPLSGVPRPARELSQRDVDVSDTTARCVWICAGQQQDRAGPRRVATKLGNDARRPQEGGRGLTAAPPRGSERLFPLPSAPTVAVARSFAEGGSHVEGESWWSVRFAACRRQHLTGCACGRARGAGVCRVSVLRPVGHVQRRRLQPLQQHLGRRRRRAVHLGVRAQATSASGPTTPRPAA